ncbi:MAG: RNA-guided endonuclease InsQ/TnpB family protein [Nitrososphaeria archaeon]
MLTYKFKLYPNRTQERLLEETLETCRRLYNQMHDDRIKNYMGYCEQKRNLVALSVEDNFVTQGNKPNDKAVGVDLGVTNVIATSDELIIEAPHYIKKAEKNVKNKQKELSKKKGSKRRKKARILLAKAWRKVRRERNDFAHKLSHQLSQSYGIVVFKDLDINGMVKNYSLASETMDSTWDKLRKFIAYKATRHGGWVILVNPGGTSQKCSGCDVVVLKDLSVRVHNCPHCRLVFDRDVNTARNILRLGLERALAEAEPLLIQRSRISKFGRGSEKPTSFRHG